MKNTYRFIGGPKHGELMAIPQSNASVRFPVYMSPFAYSADVVWYDRPDIREVIYTVRRVQLGYWTRIEVMAPRDMSEAELSRRVADFVELGAPDTR